MTATPLVSVIIPSYNHGRFVGQALESVQAQTYQHWECIVVDDGSTDDTRAAVARCAEEDARIKYLYQENQGLSAARNSGIGSAAGKYLQFLDADDLIEEEKLGRQVVYLEQHAEVDIVYSSVRYFKDGDPGERRLSMSERDAPWMPEASGSGDAMLRAMSLGNIMAVNCPLIRRTVIEAVGLFDPALPLLEDWDYWIRCAVQGQRFQFLDAERARALVRYYAASASANRERMAGAARILQKKLRSLASDPQTGRSLDLIASQIEGSLGVEQIMAGDLARGMIGLLKAGALSRKPKWFVYALAAPFASRRQFKTITSLSASKLLRSNR
jgi:glycosyltransferase involved in cell wall biosynthesis